MTFLDVAVTGTARLKAGVASTGTPVDDLVPRDAGTEQAVLLRAGALATYRLAGNRPSPARPPDAAPADAVPEATAATARLITELMQHGEPGLLRECFDRMGRRGLRLPAGLLPAVLDLADAGVHAAALAVLGERGRWLARFQPDWNWVASAAPTPAVLGPELEREWNEGSLEARRAALRTARRANAARARDWLEAAWGQEKSDVRLELLVVLADDVGPADEAFLERILDDKSQNVRALAAELLARIPDSALLKRVTERADSVLTYAAAKPGVLARLQSKVGGGPPVGTVDATPPAKLDTTWERDGVPQKAPKGIGQRAHWLASVLALIPPGHWSVRYNATPDSLVRAAWAGEWGLAVTAGWSRAALLHRATDWMPALWDGWLRARLEGAELAVQSEMLRSLLELMDAADREARVLHVLRDPPSLKGFSSDLAILLCPAPWSETFGAAYLDTIARQLKASKPDPTFLARTATAAALALPSHQFTRALDAAERGTPEPGKITPWTAPLREFTGVLQLRRRLHEEIPT